MENSDQALPWQGHLDEASLIYSGEGAANVLVIGCLAALAIIQTRLAGYWLLL